MKKTDFAKYVSSFLTSYLYNERGASKNTISSYRDTLLLLIEYIETEKNIKLEKLELEHFTKSVVVDFLNWLQSTRNCSDSTRNSRLAALHSLFKFIQYENLSYIDICQDIMSIRYKKTPKKVMKYLSTDAVSLLLEQPRVSTKRGLRDLALLSLMYDLGARVQEIIDLTPNDLRLNYPATVKLTGKGNKERLVPMIDAQVKILKEYVIRFKLNNPEFKFYPLFHNSRKEKFTRSGVNYIFQKYVSIAREKNDTIIPNQISCHTLRHSKAMHLLQAGVEVYEIQGFLGHVSIQTTEIYARADSKQKREAIEKAYEKNKPKNKKEEPMWTGNKSLINWLKGF